MSDVHEHGLSEGDRLRSERRESDLVVQEVRDRTVDFGSDVGERTHRSVASGLQTGRLERVEEGPVCRRCGSGEYLRVKRVETDSARYTSGNIVAVVCGSCGYREDDPDLRKARAIDNQEGADA